MKWKCVCGYDTTAMVERARRDWFGFSLFGRSKPPSPAREVVVTCPNGHTCRYIAT